MIFIYVWIYRLPFSYLYMCLTFSSLAGWANRCQGCICSNLTRAAKHIFAPSLSQILFIILCIGWGFWLRYMFRAPFAKLSPGMMMCLMHIESSAALSSISFTTSTRSPQLTTFTECFVPLKYLCSWKSRKGKRYLIKMENIYFDKIFYTIKKSCLNCA